MSAIVPMLETGLGSAVVVGQFNADRRDDVAVAEFGRIRVLLADADGGFDVAVSRLEGVPSVVSLLAGEFTGDGRTDLVAARFDGGVSVLTGDGLGNFTPGPAQGPMHLTSLRAVADLNSDARSDVVVTTFGSDGAALRLLLGDGAGALAQSGAFPFAADRFPAVAVGDLDAYAGSDVLLGGAAAGARGLQILSGDGSGGFRPALDGANGMPDVDAMALADFNGDERTDVAVMSNGTVRVLFGDGRGHFAAPRREIFLPSGRFAALNVSAADFNGDARADLVLSGDDTGDAFVYLGDGAGGFRPAAGTPEYGGIYPPAPVAVGDFDGDRRPDLLGLRGGGAPALRVLRNTGGRRRVTQTITIGTPFPAEVVRGERVLLWARVRCHPGRVALFRRPLRRPRGHWRRLATARTNGRGVAEVSDRPRISSQYQWRATGRGKGRTKPTRRVTVRVIRRAGTAR